MHRSFLELESGGNFDPQSTVQMQCSAAQISRLSTFEKEKNKVLSENINIKMECGITLEQRMISNFYILVNLRCYENLPAYSNVPYLASATPILRSFRCNNNNYITSYNRSTIIDSLILDITISYLLLRASTIPLGRIISNFSNS
jgi:hypothetical protein